MRDGEGRKGILAEGTAQTDREAGSAQYSGESALGCQSLWERQVSGEAADGF